jgi:multidrug transporter EmrE-like cation transporter
MKVRVYFLVISAVFSPVAVHYFVLAVSEFPFAVQYTLTVAISFLYTLVIASILPKP